MFLKYGERKKKYNKCVKNWEKEFIEKSEKKMRNGELSKKKNSSYKFFFPSFFLFKFVIPLN